MRQFKTLRRILALAGLAAVAGALGFGLWFFRGLKQEVAARSTLRGHASTVVITDRGGAVLDEIHPQGNACGFWPVESIPPKIRHGILAAEDRRFGAHDGVDGRAVVRALWQYARNFRKVSGASTLAMQTVRLEHPAKRSFRNKVVEALAAREMTRRYGRERVLRHYLTIAPFGPVYRGVSYAAERYFDKPAEDLGWAEAAFLCSLPQSPTRYDPRDGGKHRRLLSRAHRVLDRLAEDQGLTAAQLAVERWQLDRLAVRPRPDRERSAIHAIHRMREQVRAEPTSVARHHFATSLDLGLQRFAVARAGEFLDAHRDRGCDAVAMLVADARNGEILAYVGSPDYFGTAGSLDYVQVKRSSGSTLKPFLYGLAMDVRGYTGATILTDAPAVFAGHQGLYLPGNADGGYLGPMRYREALANSRNLPAIFLVEQIGVKTSLDFLRTLGFSRNEGDGETYGLAMAVGSVPVTLWELVRAYRILARGGVDGDLRWQRDGGEKKAATRLMPEDTARILAHYLSDAGARTPSFPRMSSLEYPFPVAIKTGTSFGYKDAWCLAFTGGHVLGVWVGSSKWQSMDRITGASGAGVLLRHLIHRLHPEAMRGLERVAPPAPDGWVAVNVDRRTGRPDPNGVTEYFRPGTEPRESWGTVASRLADTRTVVEPEYHAEITYPIPGSRIVLDPAVPVHLQTVTFKARVSPPSETAVWYVDGRPFAVAGEGFTCDWRPKAGTHTVELRFASAPLKSGVVEITVE